MNLSGVPQIYGLGCPLIAAGWERSLAPLLGAVWGDVLAKDHAGFLGYLPPEELSLPSVRGLSFVPPCSQGH